MNIDQNSNLNSEMEEHSNTNIVESRVQSQVHKKKKVQDLNRNLWLTYFIQKDGEQKHKITFWGQGLILVVLFFLGLIFYWGDLIVVQNRTNQWLTDWHNNPLNLQIKSAKNFVNPESDAAPSEVELNRIDQQLLEIEYRIKRSSQIAAYFYRQHHASIVLATISVIISTSCLFFISREGWTKVNKAWINALIFTSISGVLFGQMPSIFKYEENANLNLELYREHIALRNKIYTFLSTKSVVIEAENMGNKFKKPGANQFIHSIDQKLYELNQISIGFDPGKIKNIKEDNWLNLPVTSN